VVESVPLPLSPKVPQGQLIPVSEASFNHGVRTCRIGPDDKLADGSLLVSDDYADAIYRISYDGLQNR
jgi:hypothetical protein